LNCAEPAWPYLQVTLGLLTGYVVFVPSCAQPVRQSVENTKAKQ
jgi:hypothetical protein